MAMTAWRAKLLDKLDLLVGERADLLAVDGDGADQLIVLEHRHRECRPIATVVDSGGHERIALDVGPRR